MPHSATGTSDVTVFKVCTRCSARKSIDEFRLKRGKPYSQCRPCEAARTRANPNRTKASARWKRNNRGRANAISREWNRRNADRKESVRRSGRKTNWLSVLVSYAKARAADKGIEFSLDQAWIDENKDQVVCDITGLQFKFGAKRSRGLADPLAPSIDRIDPTLGYTPGNVRIVCWWANMAKSNLSDDTFRVFVSAAASRTLH